MKLIGITGKAGSGKTSLAEVLETQGYTMKAFAEPLKYIAKSWFNWNGEKDEKGRKLLQDLGSVGRAYNKDVWVKHAEKFIEARILMAKNSKYHVDEVKIVWQDVRFENEVKMIRDLGGIIIHLKGKGYDMGELNNHESEQELPIDTDKDIVLEYPRYDSKPIFREAVTEDLIRLGFITVNE